MVSNFVSFSFFLSHQICNKCPISNSYFCTFYTKLDVVLVEKTGCSDVKHWWELWIISSVMYLKNLVIHKNVTSIIKLLLHCSLWVELSSTWQFSSISNFRAGVFLSATDRKHLLQCDTADWGGSSVIKSSLHTFQAFIHHTERTFYSPSCFLVFLLASIYNCSMHSTQAGSVEMHVSFGFHSRQQSI